MNVSNGHSYEQEETKEYSNGHHNGRQIQTLRQFLIDHNLAILETSLIKLNITINHLYNLHTDDIDDLCKRINLDQYPQQEILFRSAINQLQSDTDETQQFIARSAKARSITHVVIEKKTPTKNSKDYDHLVKLVMVGDAGVGKSNLVVRFCDDAFPQSYVSTIGVDFRFRTLSYDDLTVKLQIWDTVKQ